MAYADTRLRSSPASMGAAIAANALIITGVIFAVPHTKGDPADPPLVISAFRAPTPPDDMVAINEPSVEGQSIKRQSITRPPVINDNIETTDISIGAETIDAPLPVPIGPISGIGFEPAVAKMMFKDAILNPRYRDALQPDYPPGLIRQEIEGVVTIRVLIGTDGRVRLIEPVRFDNPELLQVTEQHALRKWRFLPATRDGIAVESWREMSVRFQIPK